MKSFFSLLISLFLSQFDGFSNTPYQKLDKYFKDVHSAAAYVCRGEMDTAKSLYNSTIKSSNHTFYVDLNNAIYAEVSSRNPDTSMIISHLRQIQKKGVCVHEKYARFAKIQPYTDLVSELDCGKVHSEADRALMERMIADDQSIRDSMIQYPNSVEIGRKLHSVDSINYQLLTEILDRASNQKVTLQDFIGLKGYGNALTIIVHYSEQKYDANKIFKLVNEGILDPRNVVANFDESIERGYIKDPTELVECKGFQPFGTTAIIQTYPEIIIKIPPASCLAEINKARKKYYMQDLIEECKIKAYAQYNFKNGFAYGYSILAVDKEHLKIIEDKIIKKYKIIKYNGATDYDYNRKY